MTGATHLERTLKDGIDAYKQGDYPAAARLLRKLQQSNSRTYQLKASMGLARVYIAQQEWTKAKALCQKIGSSSKPSLQAWAKTTSDKIERRMAESAQVETPKNTKPLPQNASGFQPLNPVVNPDLDNVAANVSPQPSEPTDATDTPAGSLFHYAYLNGEDDAEAPDAEELGSSEIVSDTPMPVGDGFIWAYAGRLRKGRSIGKVKKTALLLPQLFAGAGFYFWLRFLLQQMVAGTNTGLYKLDDLLPFGIPALPYGFSDLTWPLVIGLMIVCAASPWLWDLYLLVAKRQPLSVSQLRSHSPESATIINRYCQKRRSPFPKLWKLPTEIPLIFSYGWLPRTARLVLSEGLLSELKEDEVAALVAYEMSQWKSLYWPLLSVQGLIFQGLLQLYWRLSLWANRQAKPVKWAAGFVATVSYVLFWVLRLPGLWVARSRTYYGDRAATEITGNPNALIRGLSKLSFAIAAHIQQQGHTPVFLEALVQMLPVDADLARHQLYGQMPLAQLFSWDSSNRIRHWMSCLDSHPPMGDRLRIISAYAQHWNLSPEITFPAQKRRKKGLSTQDWQQLLRQATPFIGLILGITIGLVLWLLGALGVFFDLPALDWMHKDINLLQGCVWLGVSIGTILRINRFFPDLSFSMPFSTAYADWLGDATLLPVSSLPTKLKGTLVGRPGVANWLGQDWLLNTDFGLLRLHFFSVLGPVGNVLSLSPLPSVHRGMAVQVLGWFRRGNRPWLDVDQLKATAGHSKNNVQTAHPQFSLIFAVITCALGLWALVGKPGL